MKGYEAWPIFLINLMISELWYRINKKNVKSKMGYWDLRNKQTWITLPSILIFLYFVTERSGVNNDNIAFTICISAWLAILFVIEMIRQFYKMGFEESEDKNKRL